MVVDRTGPQPRILRAVETVSSAPAAARGYLLLIGRENPLSSLRLSSTGRRR